MLLCQSSNAAERMPSGSIEKQACVHAVGHMPGHSASHCPPTLFVTLKDMKCKINDNLFTNGIISETLRRQHTIMVDPVNSMSLIN